MAESRHVQPNGEGKWEVRGPGSSRASAVKETQAEAQNAAREILRNKGGGELITHGRDGKIRDKDTVPKGNDPHPPKG